MFSKPFKLSHLQESTSKQIYRAELYGIENAMPRPLFANTVDIIMAKFPSLIKQ